jgi:hypothetical protein
MLLDTTRVQMDRTSLILHLFLYFYIRIWIQIRIVSTMLDMIQIYINVINMRFEYSDEYMLSDVEYPNSDMDGFGLFVW